MCGGGVFQLGLWEEKWDTILSIAFCKYRRRQAPNWFISQEFRERKRCLNFGETLPMFGNIPGSWKVKFNGSIQQISKFRLCIYVCLCVWWVYACLCEFVCVWMGVCLCFCEYVCICVCVCLWACLCEYVCVSVCMWSLCKYVCAIMCLHVCIFVCLYEYMCECVYLCKRMCVFAHIRMYKGDGEKYVFYLWYAIESSSWGIFQPSSLIKHVPLQCSPEWRLARGQLVTYKRISDG